jgi:hypothetical protein
MCHRQSSFQVEHERRARPRWRVSSVQQGVDPDGGHTLGRSQCSDSHEMAVVGVHPARTDQADHVKPTAWSYRSAARFQQGGPGRERAVGDRRVDPREVLEHGPTGTQVQVPDLGVAHLAWGQPNRLL